jgi:hypothetical protein
MAGGEDGRKRRFAEAGGRRDGGSGGRSLEEGDRREAAAASNRRHDGGSREAPRFEASGSCQQEGGSGHNGNNVDHQGDMYDQFRGRDGERYDRSREGWSSPPPWWREQQLREELHRQKAYTTGGDQGQGNWSGEVGQGDRGGQGQRLPPKTKGKKVAGANFGNGGKALSGKPKGGSRTGAPAGGECFKCGREGHFQSECEFDPLGVLCSSEGHTSANCLSRGKGFRLQTLGHAITGGG